MDALASAGHEGHSLQAGRLLEGLVAHGQGQAPAQSQLQVRAAASLVRRWLRARASVSCQAQLATAARRGSRLLRKGRDA
jgi:hypothetical protein